VKTFASTQLQPNARVVVDGEPGAQKLPPEIPESKPEKAAEGAGAESTNADDAWRKEPPKPGPVETAQVPTPASFTLSNGLTVIVSERTNLPIVSMALVIKTGSDANPTSKPGLANFTVGMLDQGTSTRNALKIADDAAQIGTAISTTSSMDSSRVQVRALQKNAAAAMDLVADVALHPTFPAEEVERQRGQRLNRIVARRGDPNGIASVAMASALYGSSHPYGYTELGTEPGVKSATRDDMMAFWKQNFVPGNAALVVAGAIGRDELRKLAEKTFGGWTSSQPTGAEKKAAEIAPPAGGAVSSKVVVVDLPGAPQTQMRIARIGVPRKTPDYPALEVMDMILGGLFSSRINLNLREAHGYTYGASAVFQYRKGPGPFFVASGVRTNVTGPAIAETLKELTRMQNEPVTADELTLARDSLIRSLPGAFETTLSSVGTFAGLYVYDLGLDYYAKYPQQISSVGAAEVQAVAKRYLTPGSFVVVLVGDRAKIAPQLQSLKLGTTELRDTDGNPKTR